MLVAPLFLVACASAPVEPTLVIVGKDDFKVFGTSVRSGAELTAILSAKQATKVVLRPEPDINYEQIGKAIYATTRSGATIVRVDAMAEK